MENDNIEKKRNNWDRDETRFFLNLMLDRKVMKCLDGKKFRADQIYIHLESPMAEKGYKKNAKQMQDRFRNLRRK